MLELTTADSGSSLPSDGGTEWARLFPLMALRVICRDCTKTDGLEAKRTVPMSYDYVP